MNRTHPFVGFGIILKASFLIAALVIPLSVFAAPSMPAESLWVTPIDAKAGDAIALNALIYNGTAKSATVTIVFSDGALDIGTISMSVPAQSAKVGIQAWTFPETPTTVNATVTKATDSNGKSVPDLLGEIATLTVGGASPAIDTGNVEKQLKGILGTVFGRIDPWRERQAHHFRTLRDAKKAQLGINNPKDIYDVATSPSSSSQTDQVNIPAYATLIYSTALASVFSSVALFYITLALLALLIIRFIVRFFR